MRIGIVTTLFVLALASASTVEAQVDGCSDQAVALAADGTPLDLELLRRDVEQKGAPIELDWCGGDDDVRCRSIPPAPDAPSYDSPADAPRFLPSAHGLSLASTETMLGSALGLRPEPSSAGPSGVDGSLDRPPRAR